MAYSRHAVRWILPDAVSTGAAAGARAALSAASRRGRNAARVRAVFAVVLTVAVAGWPRPGGATTATPTASPTPHPTGVLGTKQVVGHVYDAQNSGDVPIAGATVSYVAPAGSGSVQTDAAGAFSFPLFLRDTDRIVIGAAAAGFHGAETSYTGLGLWVEASLVMRLVPAAPGTYRVSGTLSRDPYCPPAALITLEIAEVDGGFAQTTSLLSDTGEFAFEGVRNGDYVVSAAPECQPSHYEPVAVSVRDTDAQVELNWDMCPPGLVLHPAHGLPGTTVAVAGRCYYIHSGGTARVYRDAVLVAEVHAGTSGDYEAEVLVPDDAQPGWHTIEVTTATDAPIGSGRFYVNAQSPPACAGDCDRDGVVTVDELLTIVNRALGNIVEFPGCPAAVADGGGPVRIEHLIAAVDAALSGCAGAQFGTCYESAECAPYQFGPHEQFAATRQSCCSLWTTSRNVPFTWCPAEAYDPSSGECDLCESAC